MDMLHGSCGVLASGKRRRIKYTALSYCWGEPEFDKEILLDVHPYPITQNLFDALVQLRDRTNVAALWIDALCTFLL